MESIGERLKKIRLEKGYTLEEVHKNTKIHYNVLRAIEEDRLAHFSPIYIKGFLKIYCNFLGVNHKEYIPDFKEVTPVAEALPKKNKEMAASSVKMPDIVSNIIRFIRGKIKIIVFLVLVFLAVKGTVNFTKFVVKKIKQRPARVVSRKDDKPVPAQAGQSAKETLQVRPIAAQNASSGIRLSIRAKNNCWIQVKADGKAVFQNILRKGRAENWQADKKIELSLGNAGVVEMEVNGKLISKLGRPGQAIKNILITKDGLSVLR